MMRKALPLIALCFLIVAQACKDEPAPQKAPVAVPGKPGAAIRFDRIEASGPNIITVRTLITVTNPRGAAAVVTLAKSRIFVNDAELEAGWDFKADEGRVGANSSVELKAAYTLHLKNLSPPLDKSAEALNIRVTADLGFVWDGGSRSTARASAQAAIPHIREPSFEIVNIAIMQAELINTRFRVKVRISNPNPFPVKLSDFSYELYGQGRFWADGDEKDIYEIPEKGQAEEDLFLLMNFIEMRRDILDKVIAMDRVKYQFKGYAQIETGIEYLPSFTTIFDLKGESDVVK
jgi:LEA14-like dessication related protein